MNRRALILLGVCGMILDLGRAAVFAADADRAFPALVPRPQQVEWKEGAFVLQKDTVILADAQCPGAAGVARLLAERIRQSTGLDILVQSTESAETVRNAIHLTTQKADPSLGPEGYVLTVAPDGAIITARGGAGLFYGTQTLLQLLPPEVFSPVKVEKAAAWAAPAVRIEDRPRFPWRGLMVDVGRHFFSKDEIKNFIDLMAQHKLNTFHWHLTEDQGWRIEIKRYPKLTEIGAWRKGIGFGLDPQSSTAYGPDGRYGGFYTQDDIREVVAYAQARYVTVVPEIEMPGHAVAALAAYPELSCTGGPFTTDGPAGIFRDVFCAGNDATFEFLENVLSEVLELFPSKMIHVGGDEVPKTNWEKCEKCQARIRKEGLKDENELQSYFIRRIEKFLADRGRTLIGWEEILEGGLPTSAAVMSWRRQGDVGMAAANAGHKVVMIPGYRCYLSRGQGPVMAEPPGDPKKARRRGDPLTLEMVYGFEPVVEGIAPDKAQNVIGSGGAFWSEGIANYARLQLLAYPRACATAELTWLDPERKNLADFQVRIAAHLERLRLQGVNYYQVRLNP